MRARDAVPPHACLAAASTLEPCTLALGALAVDAQTVPENVCTHATFGRLGAGASRFGALRCLVSAFNVSVADARTAFLLIEGLHWGISAAADLADPSLNWDLRAVDDARQRAATQAGLTRSMDTLQLLRQQLPRNAPLRVAAASAQLPLATVLHEAAHKALGGGAAGAVAMTVNVACLMWMRTIVQFQYR